MTALQKDTGVKGIMAGDVVRRLVAKTMARQMSEAVQVATSPFQFAFSTRVGCECVAHTLHALTEVDPEATILSFDGINAFDLVSDSAMLRGLASVAGGPEATPFVQMFYGQPSLYIWEDDQAEGGEQGDALMPLLFALGQHSALASVQEGLTPDQDIVSKSWCCLCFCGGRVVPTCKDPRPSSCTRHP